MTNTILRLPEVRARTGLSRSTIYAFMADGTFPLPVALGARAVGWLESKINEWNESRIIKGRKQDKSKHVEPQQNVSAS